MVQPEEFKEYKKELLNTKIFDTKYVTMAGHSIENFNIKRQEILSE